MINVKITQRPTFNIEVDGKKVPGEFYVASEWNEFIELRSHAPNCRIIIRKPHIPNVQIYDLVPKLFGGNRESTKPLEIEVDHVGGDELKP